MPNESRVALFALAAVAVAAGGCRQSSQVAGNWRVDVEATVADRAAYLVSLMRVEGGEGDRVKEAIRSQTRAELERELGAATLELTGDHRFRFTRTVRSQPSVEEGSWDDGPKRPVPGAAAVLTVERVDGQPAPEARPLGEGGALGASTRVVETVDGTRDRLRLALNRPLAGGIPSRMVIHLARHP